MNILIYIKELLANAINEVYASSFTLKELTINETKENFYGDYTLVTFSLAKQLKTSPPEIAQRLGEKLMENKSVFKNFEVVQGFLNFSLQNNIFISQLEKNFDKKEIQLASTSQKVMIEFASPNTNKPIHFGHLRNIFLGNSLSNIMTAAGNEVIKANLINDRGIHICKSMIAWQIFANGETPESTNIKGDHFVGDYYVKFNEVYKKEISELVSSGMSEKEAEKEAPIFKNAQEMLRKWEADDEEILALWKKMNGWVYVGFDETFKKLHVAFDKMYYESETYLKGKEIVLEAKKENLLKQKEDSSIWIDLTQEGLDEKILLRSDGTSVYITQDIGTAEIKYNDFKIDQSIYVIGDEQNYHMQVLKLALKKMNKNYADGIFHLSYGMVELPSGKMKSREGNVVDADDMIAEMKLIAQQNTEEKGKVEHFSTEELEQLYDTIGLGALKFYLLRVDPKKKMIFDPKESIDMHGFTAPFIQYCHARLFSILSKSDVNEIDLATYEISETEKKLIKNLAQFEHVILQASQEHNPSLICNYTFQLAQETNGFLTSHSVLKADTELEKQFRLRLCLFSKNTIKSAMQLLGINVPDRM